MTKIITDQQSLENLLKRYVETAYPSWEKVQERLKTGQQLSFYLGIDPTGPDLHLGNSTNLLLLKRLAQLGHRIILLIGDFTAQIGDPTDKEATRQPLTPEQVKSNLKTYVKQVSKILTDFKVVYNSRWLAKLTFRELIGLASKITVQQLLAREMFQRRLAEQKPISLHEFFYPLMQGYDSVALKIDGEVGGNDQTFNMLVGRDFSRQILKKDKLVITTPLLEDLSSGKKLMNKSEGRYVALNDSSEEMFGKVMASLPDAMIKTVFKLCTERDLIEVERISREKEARDFKLELAWELVKMYHGLSAADQARERFIRIFSKKQSLKEEEWRVIKVKSLSGNLVEIMKEAGLVGSRGEAKRLIKQKAVKINGQLVSDWSHQGLNQRELKIAIGPRRFYRLVVIS